MDWHEEQRTYLTSLIFYVVVWCNAIKFYVVVAFLNSNFGVQRFD